MTAAGQRPAILLTGATGCIGGRLLAVLEARGHRVRCLTRRPAALAERLGPHTCAVRGDCLDPASLQGAFAGISTAYYLVHSMGNAADFEAQDRAAARNFGAAARSAGVRRIVYMGGLGASAALSRHLRSRHETGEVLRESGVPVVEFRSAVVIGAGSLSFELIRALVERLPVMVCPAWVCTATQPIALADVAAYLAAALYLPHGDSRVFEVGGADIVSYGGIMQEYARQRGLRRRLIPVPLLTPRLSSLWLGLTTPVYARVGRELIDGLRTATVVNDAAARTAFRVRPRGLRQAIAGALEEEDAAFAAGPWSEARYGPDGSALGRRPHPDPARSLVRRRRARGAGRRFRAHPAHRRRQRLVLRRLDLAPARPRRPAARWGGHAPRPARSAATGGGRRAGLLAGGGMRARCPLAAGRRNEGARPCLAAVRRHAA